MPGNAIRSAPTRDRALGSAQALGEDFIGQSPKQGIFRLGPDPVFGRIAQTATTSEHGGSRPFQKCGDYLVGGSAEQLVFFGTEGPGPRVGEGNVEYISALRDGINGNAKAGGQHFVADSAQELEEFGGPGTRMRAALDANTKLSAAVGDGHRMSPELAGDFKVRVRAHELVFLRSPVAASSSARVRGAGLQGLPAAAKARSDSCAGLRILFVWWHSQPGP